MKKYRLHLPLIFLFIAFTLQAQKAKKPTLMVFPSDAWCLEKGYMQKTMDTEGNIIEKVPDYEKAFRENTELLLVISTINGLMAERGFPLKNLETEIKGRAATRAKDVLRSSPTVSRSPIDDITKKARADIIVQLTWVVNENQNAKKFVTYNLQGLDAYTYKQISTATGSGRPSFSADLPILLEEAVIENIENFTRTLSEYFDDMFENGREVTLQILTADNWNGDLNELSFEIEDWLSANSQEGIFSTSEITDSYALFEQVRMPLFDKNNKPLAARNFFRELSKTLNAPPYNQPNKIETEGLGKVTIILKEK